MATTYGQSFLLQLEIYGDPHESAYSIKITLEGAQKIVKIHELKIELSSNTDNANYDMQEKIRFENELAKELSDNESENEYRINEATGYLDRCYENVYLIEDIFNKSIFGDRWCEFNVKEFDEIKVSGEIKISFVPEFNYDLYEKMYGALSTLLPIKDPSDFVVIVNEDGNRGHKFHFHKEILIAISPVLRVMLENENTMEAKNGELILVDFEVQTIKTFHEILYKNKVDLGEVGLDLQFLLFCHKYDIKFMFSATKSYLYVKLAKPNPNTELLIEVIKAADMIDDKEMFDVAMVIDELKLWKQSDRLERNKNWVEFKKDNIQLFEKVHKIFRSMM